MKKIVRRMTMFPILFIVVALGVRAADPIPNNFAHLTIRDGLSQGSAEAILQDSRGFLWIGTEDGLNRYDGYDFKVYQAGPAPNMLCDKWVRALCEDSQGALWVGTINGLNRYDRETDDFLRFLNRPSDPRSLSNNGVTAILEDQSKTMWICTEGGGLNRFDRMSGTFRSYKNDPGNPTSLSHNDVYDICQTRDGALWVATGGGLNKFDPATGTFVRFHHDPKNPLSLSADQTRVVFEDRAGALWVGTQGGGLNVLDRATGRFKVYRNVFGRPRSLSNDDIYAIAEDRQDRLFVATINGLNQYEPKTDDFTVLRNDPLDPDSLSYDYVVSIYEDRTGILWIGTKGKGLDKYVPDHNKFRLYMHRPGTPDSLTSNTIRAITEDASRVLWIGTEDKGLDRLDRRARTVVHYGHEPLRPSSLSNDNVYALQIDAGGSLWIGTLGGGLDRFDPRIGQFAHFRHSVADPGSLSRDSIRSLCLERNGTLWVGTEGGGLNRLDPGRSSFIHYRHDPKDPSSLSHDVVRTMFQDRGGTLWVGTFGGGLNRWDPKARSFVHYRHDPSNPASLCSDFLMSLAEDSQGNLWIGSNEGLTELDPRTGRVSCYSEKDGLPNANIYSVLIDASDKIWVSSNKGIARFDPRSRSVKTYGVSDGLQSNEFNGGANYMTAAGEMFFGGTSGLNSFFPDMLKDNPYPPAVVITDFQIYNKSVPIGGKIGGRIVLSRSITETREIVLDRGAGMISFEFAALHFAAPEKNRFAYIMEGLETEWNQVQGRRFVSYTNLNPGHYVFRVRAANNDGLWNKAGVALDIRVIPPLWMRWWFRAAAVFLIGLAGYSLVRRRIGAIQRRASVLERRVGERTAELRQQVEVRRKAEAELERRQKYLEAVLFNSSNAIVTTDTAALITDWSPGAEKTFGWSRDEVIGRNIDDVVILPEFKDEAVRRQKATLSGQTVSAAKGVRHRKGGTPIDVIVAGSPIVIGGKIVGTVFVYTDVTDLKRAEAELERRQKYLETVLFNSPNAIVTTDTNSLITEWSPGAEKMFGRRREEVLGQNIDDVVIRPEFRDEAVRRQEAALSGQSASVEEAVRHYKDGTPIDVILAGSPIVIGGEIFGSMAVYTDITELKRAEAAAHEASRAKSEFLANMSHEIRTPMNGIFGMTELALDTELTPEQREYMEAVKTSAESLMTIINDILDFSKIEANKIDLEAIPFRLRDTVHAIVSSVALLAEKKGLEVVYAIPPDVPDGVRGDPGRLRQILTNLMGNAIKFTSRGEIFVSVSVDERRPDGATVHFQVRDTGIGIPAEKLPKVFEPFTQADSSTTREYGGTGLGLAICTQLVSLMKGKIWAESEMGRGSTFHFVIPLGVESGEVDERAQVQFSDLRGLPVLIVDDNATNRRILKDMLSHWAMTPETVESGASALEALRSAAGEGRPFRLILTDANMPEMDGFHLAAEIKGNPAFGNAIIMMLSSSGFRGDSAHCRSLGLSAYLTKPIKQSQLLDAILLALGTAPDKTNEAPLITRHSLAQAHGRFSVLLAEDNLINQKLAARILENRGHKVTIVGNGQEALEVMETGNFDVILMDVQMPVLDGFQATARIRDGERGSDRHIPIVAMTAHAMKGDREKCLAAGMDDYVTKPLKPVDFLKTLEQAVDKFRRRP